MRLVVDASAIVELLARTSAGEAAGRHLAGAEAVYAPELLDLEVTNAIRREALAGRLSAPAARRSIAGLAALAVERVPHLPLLGRIWALRDRLTAYDAAYVALAQTVNGRVLTADGRLARGAPRGRAILL